MKPHKRPGKAAKDARIARARERGMEMASYLTKRRLDLAVAMREDVENMRQQLGWTNDRFRRHFLESQIRDLELSIATLLAD